MPIRLKQVHVINAPSYIGKIHALCKPFLKAEVAKLVSTIVYRLAETWQASTISKLI